MKTIALVSITLNAVNPMTDYLNAATEGIKVRNYLDSGLMDKIRADGRITDESTGRMFGLLCRAAADGADGIILTCTVFSGHVPHFSALLSVPLICPDGAMLSGAAAAEGTKAIICTFEGTVLPTKALYLSYCREYRRPEEIAMYTLPEAYEAMQRGDIKRANQLILEKVKELDRQYDHVVLAQISMAGAVRGYRPQHAVIHTSPASAYQVLQAAMGS